MAHLNEPGPRLQSVDGLRFLVGRLRERLWVRPLVTGLISVGAVFAVTLADRTSLAQLVPKVTVQSLDTLLSVMAASMLVIATFAVGSMVSAYASASSSATPRAFTLVLADDHSQNALSTFVGAFIFSIVALTALENDAFGDAACFALMVLTTVVFGGVILTLLRWVDGVARLGRLVETIARVERATEAALQRRRAAPHLRALPPNGDEGFDLPVFAARVGYVQHVDVAALQACAAAAQGWIRVAALPGTFAAPGRPLAYLSAPETIDRDAVARAFAIGDNRRFDDDPRFGLVVLSEIAGRALSPAVNDPGTAIGVIGALVRLFAGWGAPREVDPPAFDRVQVPALAIDDMFDDAFTAIARDGAGSVEVPLRLVKALESLAGLDDPAMQEAASRHAQWALERARGALGLEHDRRRVEEAVARIAR